MPADLCDLPVGKAEIIRPGDKVQIWALGDMIPMAQKAASLIESTKKVSVGIVNPRFIRPLDESLLTEQARSATVFVTIETALATGGFGSVVEESLCRHGFGGRVFRFGWPDEYVPHGAPEILMEKYGLTAEAVAKAVAGAIA